VLGRALRLCAAGRSEADCDERIIAMLRTANLVSAGAEVDRALSSYRPPSGVEIALTYVADALFRPELCAGVGRDAMALGWSDQSGLSFVTLRTACQMRVAALTGQGADCAGVAPVDRDDLDGWAGTENMCRERIADSAEPFPRSPEAPDWPGLFAWLGYDPAELRDATSFAPSEALLAYMSSALNAEHEDFVTRIVDHARVGVPQTNVPTHYSEIDLQRRSYQLAATRFHCRKTWEEVPEDQRTSDIYSVPEYARYELTDQNGMRVTQAEFAGGYSLFYFGFTYCPDVCPTSLSAMTIAVQRLETQGVSIRPVFVTLDARRDTPEVLAEYVAYFGETFVGLTGSERDIQRAARAFNVYHFAGDIDGEYVVEHTSYFYLAGPDGRTVKYFDYGVDPYDMAAEIAAIIDGELYGRGSAGEDGPTGRHCALDSTINRVTD